MRWLIDRDAGVISDAEHAEPEKNPYRERDRQKCLTAATRNLPIHRAAHVQLETASDTEVLQLVDSLGLAGMRDFRRDHYPGPLYTVLTSEQLAYLKRQLPEDLPYVGTQAAHRV